MSHLVDWGDVESQSDIDKKNEIDYISGYTDGDKIIQTKEVLKNQKSSTKKIMPKSSTPKIEKILSADEFYYLCKCVDAKRQGKLKFKILDLKNKLQSITNFEKEEN